MTLAAEHLKLLQAYTMMMLVTMMMMVVVMMMVMMLIPSQIHSFIYTEHLT